MNALEQIPSRIRYYLLEWKDNNMSYFRKKYNDRKLMELSHEELVQFFKHASESDLKSISK